MSNIDAPTGRPRPRIAIAHDYLTQRGGAERVALTLARAFPHAPIYTTLYDPERTYPEFQHLDVRTTWLNRVGALRRNHRAALPLLPLAASSLEIDADVVISSSSGWSHGFRTSGKKLVYCYAPARWLYEPSRYLGEDSPATIKLALSALTPVLRIWDRRAARSADQYLAISTVTQCRIRETYGVEAPIIPAPHRMATRRSSPSSPSNTPESDFFLLVSRLLPYKNVLEVVRAFASRPERSLVVVGSGPQKSLLVRSAPSNVTFLENLNDAELETLYSRCLGLISSAHEDFGLTPLEAAAFGKPSAVLRWGGFLDTVIEGDTGVFFDHADPTLIGHAVDELATRTWDAELIRTRAGEFSEEAFIARIVEQVDILSPPA